MITLVSIKFVLEPKKKKANELTDDIGNTNSENNKNENILGI